MKLLPVTAAFFVLLKSILALSQLVRATFASVGVGAAMRRHAWLWRSGANKARNAPSTIVANGDHQARTCCPAGPSGIQKAVAGLYDPLLPSICPRPWPETTALFLKSLKLNKDSYVARGRVQNASGLGPEGNGPRPL
jgi:hypothetical protein